MRERSCGVCGVPVGDLFSAVVWMRSLDSETEGQDFGSMVGFGLDAIPSSPIPIHTFPPCMQCGKCAAVWLAYIDGLWLADRWSSNVELRSTMVHVHVSISSSELQDI